METPRLVFEPYSSLNSTFIYSNVSMWSECCVVWVATAAVFREQAVTTLLCYREIKGNCQKEHGEGQHKTCRAPSSAAVSTSLGVFRRGGRCLAASSCLITIYGGHNVLFKHFCLPLQNCYYIHIEVHTNFKNLAGRYHITYYKYCTTLKNNRKVFLSMQR